MKLKEKINADYMLAFKSKNTIAPIEYVPDVILYVDGVPYIRYDGPHEIDNIKSFIFNVYEKLQKTCFSNNEQQQQQQPSVKQQLHNTGHANAPYKQQPHVIREVKNSIPEYTVGVPVCGKRNDSNKCYLEFKTAYNSVKA
jgi:hypothetical protein